MHNDTLFHIIDTTIYNLEQFEFKYRTEEVYQDLGNNGTAIRPIYYSLPEKIGRRTGFNSYSPYVKQADDFKYYDTKSPFINLNLGLGGKNRNSVDFEFSRNINPQWNIGFDINKISSNKLIGSSSLRETQISSTSSDFYVFYRSKNAKYHAMFHGYKFDHKASETGGIKIDETTPEKDYFLYQDSDINLRNAVSYDERTRLHLYQEYSLKEYFEIYNIIERTKIKNKYEDFPLSQTVDYYEDYLISTDTTADASLLSEWKITAGIKGRLGQRIFYSAYVKRKEIDFEYKYLSPFQRVSENYLGGDIKVYVTPTNALSGSVEVLTGGQYYFKGMFENNFLRASYSSSLSRPSFMSERYFGNHYEWYNDFNDIFTNSITGSIFYAFPFLRIEPAVEITTLNNYVYFGTDKRPTQNADVVLLNKYSVKADVRLGKHFNFHNKLIFNNVSGEGADAIRTPDWNYAGKWYYENLVFNDFMQFQLGFDFRWQSAYFANAYDPITQQFYIQNDFKIDTYWTGDLFFILSARKLSIWIKWKYFNQKKQDGYFETPLYPATRKVIDLGVRWYFYD